MFVLLFFIYVRGCIFTCGDSIFTDGFSDNIQWVNIEDYTNFNLEYCDFIVASSPPGYIDGFSDSLLVEYVKNGGRLYLEAGDFTKYPVLQSYVQYVVSKSYAKNILHAKGKGIFSGLDLVLDSVPPVFFTIDTMRVLNYLEVEDVPLMGKSVILYTFSLGKGSIMVSNFPFMKESSCDILRERIEGYFFPDISIITNSLKYSWRKLIEGAYEKAHMFVRVYDSDFQGVPPGKLVVTDVSQDIIGPDTAMILYMGPYVCNEFYKCDTLVPYGTFYLREHSFMLRNFSSLAAKNAGKNEVVFVNEAGKTVGFILRDEKVGFLPFHLEDLTDDDVIDFLLTLSNFDVSVADVKKKLEGFKGPLNGVFHDAGELIVFTVDGRIVYRAQGTTGVVYDFTPLPDGLYIIKLKLNTGRDSLMFLNKLQGEGQ